MKNEENLMSAQLILPSLGRLLSVRFKYMPGYTSSDLLKIRVLSMVENLNAVISTNQSNRFRTGHMDYNLAYN